MDPMMIDNRLRFSVQADPWKRFALSLYVMKLGDARQDSWHVATGFTFTEIPRGGDAPVCAALEREEAQLLANALWDAGIRPEQSLQGQGMFEAQRRHLEDMRAIVSQQGKVALKL